MNQTDKELDKIFEELPSYWKGVGEKKYVEDSCRYLMKHTELLKNEAIKNVYDHLFGRLVKLWCKETNTEDEVWMSNFIETIFKGQIQRTPAYAERGKEHIETLLKKILG